MLLHINLVNNMTWWKQISFLYLTEKMLLISRWFHLRFYKTTTDNPILYFVTSCLMNNTNLIIKLLPLITGKLSERVKCFLSTFICYLLLFNHIFGVILILHSHKNGWNNNVEHISVVQFALNQLHFQMPHWTYNLLVSPPKCVFSKS